MDNITHSIIGFGAGELIHRSLPQEKQEDDQRVRHRLLLVSCVLASNFPDLDLVLTKLLPAPLGYLLNHRGHTHTALLAIPQALLLAALLWLLWPSARRLLQASSTARRGLAVSIVTGFALHLGMDYTNSYGVHPWYPFDGRWVYGDMVFIVEPLFWVAIGVPMALIMRWRTARWIALAGLLAALGGFAVKGYLGWLALAILLKVGVFCGAVQSRAGKRGVAGVATGLLIGAGFIAVQGVASHVGRVQITTALHQVDPGARVLDVVMTAFPSQPLCWAYVSVESNEAAGTYRMRRGIASIAPQWLSPLSCSPGLVEHGASVALAPGIAQFETEQDSLQQLRALSANNCLVNAWLRFGRAPALDATGGTLSDYRFAMTPRGNFSTLDLEPQQPCPTGVPNWGYPRADLLTPAVK
jgi:inner membrane protein